MFGLGCSGGGEFWDPVESVMGVAGVEDEAFLWVFGCIGLRQKQLCIGALLCLYS